MSNPVPVRRILLATILVVLLLMGTVEIYSTLVFAEGYRHPQVMAFVEYLVRMFLALVVFVVTLRVPLPAWAESRKPLALFTLLLLVGVLLFGTEIKGAQRWIFGIQPAEVGKVYLIVYLAWYLSDRRPHLYPGFAPWLPPLLWSGVLTLLIILQPNFSTAGLYLLLTAAFLWVGGMPFRAFLAVGVATMAFVGLAYRFSPHVHTRMDLFLHGDLHEQVRWALATLKHGGLLGVGPGRGVLKHNVPQAQNDFMFASVGEDLGLVGAVLVIVLFLLLWALGYRLLQEERWRFEWYLVYGAVVLLISQAFLHIAVNLGVFPITGQVLPFLSQGGSNLLVSAWAAGILWNASRLPW